MYCGAEKILVDTQCCTGNVVDAICTEDFLCFVDESKKAFVQSIEVVDQKRVVCSEQYWIKGSVSKLIPALENRLLVIDPSDNVTMVNLSRYTSGERKKVETVASKLSYFPFWNSLACSIRLPEKVNAVACGGGHILFATFSGACFAMGDNSYGQCGLELQGGEAPRHFVQVPSRVLDDGGILRTETHDVAAGEFHSLFLSRTHGVVLVAGRNDRGQLGLPSTITSVSSPICLNFSNSRTYKKVQQ